VDHQRCQVDARLLGDGALEHQGAARLGGGDGGAKSLGPARGLDDQGRRFRGPVTRQARLDAATCQDRELGRVSTHGQDPRAGILEHLGDEQAELAVAEHETSRARLERHLLEDLEGGGEGFGEDGALVRHVVGHLVEVAGGNPYPLREGAVRALDSHHAAGRAVPGKTSRARRAAAAREVDLADDAATAPAFGAVLHDADELVPQHAAEAHVALHQLEVGVAHARQ
jgi:hypothetical protein